MPMDTKPKRDSFEERRQHLAAMSDQEIYEYFWQLANQIVNPLIDIAKTHTSPSIERSVLLRMGFSSIESKAIVEQSLQHGLIAKGCGHLVYRLSILKNMSVRDAGLLLAEGQGFDELAKQFGVKS